MGPVPTVDEITEAHLKNCVEDRARVKPEDYDLAQIERGIKDVRLNKSRNLEMQVWQLGLRYATTLENLGYSAFISSKPKLAIDHILKRITHEKLSNRMKLTYKLRKEELKENYLLFMRELAKEAKACDRHDAASVSADQNDGSDSDRCDKESIKSRDGRRHRKQKKGRPFVKDTITERKPTDGDSSKKRSRPHCLNPNCDDRHFMNECPNTTAAKKKELLDAYRAKTPKFSKDRSGSVGQISSSKKEESCSLFEATFCDGAVEVSVLAEQGSDVNLTPPHVLDLIKKSDSTLKIENLGRTFYYGTVDKSAPALPCSRLVHANLMLNVRHGTQLALRGMEWMVSDKPVQNVLINRHVLQSIGLDNCKLLAAAADRFRGVVNVPELLGNNDRKSTVDSGSIQSLLRENNLEFGSTFHSQGGSEDDRLDDSSVYVDIGEDTAEALDSALASRVEQALTNGISPDGSKKLDFLLQKYKRVSSKAGQIPTSPSRAYEGTSGVRKAPCTRQGAEVFSRATTVLGEIH